MAEAVVGLEDVMWPGCAEFVRLGPVQLAADSLIGHHAHNGHADDGEWQMRLGN